MATFALIVMLMTVSMLMPLRLVPALLTVVVLLLALVAYLIPALGRRTRPTIVPRVLVTASSTVHAMLPCPFLASHECSARRVLWIVTKIVLIVQALCSFADSAGVLDSPRVPSLIVVVVHHLVESPLPFTLSAIVWLLLVPFLLLATRLP